jgi:hypothetical protein
MKKTSGEQEMGKTKCMWCIFAALADQSIISYRGNGGIKTQKVA